MPGSKGSNKRNIESDKVGLAIVSSLVVGNEITSDRQSVTQHLPNSSTYFVNKPLNPLVINPNPIYKNIAVISNPVSSQTRSIRPCLFTSIDPVSFSRAKQSQINSKNDDPDAELTICSTHGNSGFLRLADIQETDEYTCVRNGLIFEVVHMFNDCILEFPSSQLKIFSLNDKQLAILPRPSGCSTQYFESDNFLKYCYICNKSLDGKDIYMYSDNPFCSNECRDKEYMNDCNLMKDVMSVHQ
ncbi:hypothetical protein Fot_54359 [Forsythia ovata]|uniref:FLZ-type domain-containing protein n=1 Tax=Forsythia ovata TaxID=205694 RepID=A0ABD1PGZ2_9LAMI